MTRRPAAGRNRLLILVVLLLLVAVLLYRGRAPGAPFEQRTSDQPAAIRFHDMAPAHGLSQLRWSASLRAARIIGTVGGGVAWGDYDGDGWPDLYLTQGISRPGDPHHPANCGRLLRNEQGRGFRDVTSESGIRACGWGMGALFEDLDGDGNLDLLLTFLGENQLWWNQGDGTFREGAAEAGVASEGWHTGAAALDATGNGHLDLYIGRYLATTPELERQRPAFELLPIESYEPRGDLLFLNQGSRRFLPASHDAVAAPEGRALGVVAVDLDHDGQADLYVANDLQRNTLLRGRGDGTFEDVTELAGVGVGEDGRPEAGMGVAVGDLTGNGLPDLVVSNFAAEPANLFANLGEMVFADEARSRGLHGPTFEWLGWATELIDFDNSGHLDLYVAHGHLLPPWVLRMARLFGRAPTEAGGETFVGPFRQPLAMLRGRDGTLSAASRETERIGVWRGGAAADFDLDGRIDLFLYSSERRTPSLLLANRTGAGNWLQVSLRAPGAPPPAAGQRVVISGPSSIAPTSRILGASSLTLQSQVTSGGSYLSGSARPLHFGLGRTGTVDVELLRPGARVLRLEGVRSGGVLILPALGASDGRASG